MPEEQGYFPMYSLVDILEGMSFPEFCRKNSFNRGDGSDLHDEVLTPVSHGKSMAGVEVHANILDTVLTRKIFKTRKPDCYSVCKYRFWF